MATTSAPTTQPPAFRWLTTTIDDPNNWGRWRPGASQQQEGGVDLTLPSGTPIYALGTGPLQGWGTFTHADGTPGYGVLTEQTDVPGLGKANVYYQHIDLLPVFKACQNGQCNGQQVTRGQLIGYTHPGYYGLEVGINPSWGGVWSGTTAPGPWVNDPRPYLKQLALTGVNPGQQFGQPIIEQVAACQQPSSPLDAGGWIGYVWCQMNQALISFGEHIAIFLLGMLLIGAGIYLLMHQPQGTAPRPPASKVPEL